MESGPTRPNQHTAAMVERTGSANQGQFGCTRNVSRKCGSQHKSNETIRNFPIFILRNAFPRNVSLAAEVALISFKCDRGPLTTMPLNTILTKNFPLMIPSASFYTIHKVLLAEISRVFKWYETSSRPTSECIRYLATPHVINSEIGI
ncbi:hypothetical protein BS47DRAFT_307739 [Hydnum rufescens UP504]|uniref:Uncharacterized protein n=1 Tax=Hydnum rufescens UP504 TaxID=1448309 RepID=A0A9P6DQL7_9AGAM|nr:hypothetical protein BS47DRAFT_307739 [Hydnum rufescens UP504]